MHNPRHCNAGRPARGLLLHPLAEAKEARYRMLWTIFIILLVLWLLGMVSSYTMGGFIHLLLVIAVVVVLIRIIQGRSPV
jgi:hypothetical protein